MFQFIYVSSARGKLSSDDLASILAEARARNSALGVTGMLLYHDGNIMQALEGERSVVEDLAARIERDPRHHGFLVLSRREIGEREFASWSMGFVDTRAVDAEHADAMNTLLRAPEGAAHLFREPGRGHALMMSFRRNLR